MIPISFRQKRLPCRLVFNCSRLLNCLYRKQSGKCSAKWDRGLTRRNIESLTSPPTLSMVKVAGGEGGGVGQSTCQGARVGVTGIARIMEEYSLGIPFETLPTISGTI